jgi:hypothetical protein
MHLMCYRFCVPGEAMLSLMPGALGMHKHTSEAESHGKYGNVRALPYREAGLESQDTWRHRSPSLSGGEPGATGHLATPEPSHTERRVWSRGTHGDTGALPCRGGGPDGMGHMTTVEPFCTERWVWSHGTCGDTGALPYQVACPVPRGTW